MLLMSSATQSSRKDDWSAYKREDKIGVESTTQAHQSHIQDLFVSLLNNYRVIRMLPGSSANTLVNLTLLSIRSGLPTLSLLANH